MPEPLTEIAVRKNLFRQISPEAIKRAFLDDVRKSLDDLNKHCRGVVLRRKLGKQWTTVQQ